MLRECAFSGTFLLALASTDAAAEWTERPSLAASLRQFRTDHELKLSGAAAYSLPLSWQPSLRWESSGRMTRVGALNRDKRDSSLRASMDVAPWEGCSLRFSTTGWRRRDEGTLLLERAAGASVEGRMSLELPAGFSLIQGVGVIRDQVASAGLSGSEKDNGGRRAETEIRVSRRIGGRSVSLQGRRQVRDVTLDGLEERAVALRIDGKTAQADVEAFSARRRYITGAIEEQRRDRGGTIRLGGSVSQELTWEYRGSTSRTHYLAGTNQDFMTGSQALRIQLQPRVPFLAPFVRMNLRHQSYDECSRTIYDRFDAAQALEAGAEVGGRDSLMVLRVVHQISLDTSTYEDTANFSDHDIRDQRITADLWWRPGAWSWKLSLGRRRNDLVYVDAERSANTVRTTEYSLSLTYAIQASLIRWSQNWLISARHAEYRFKPDSDALSRRGMVESRLSTQGKAVEWEVFQKWLWDDTGPYGQGVFARLELTDDVELGARLSAAAARWKVAPTVRHRWRFLYGPQGRAGGLSRPAQRERRIGVELLMPIGSRGVTVAATRVRKGGVGHWEASAEVGHGL